MNENEKKVRADVEQVYDELSKTGVSFWLMSGSALGAALQGRMLSGDRDVDLGVKAHDREQIRPSLSVLEKKGFKITERYDPVNKEIKGMITLRRNVPFDIKFYNCNNEKCWRALHKSHSFFSTLVWQCVDAAFFEKKPKVKIEKKIYRSIVSYLTTRAVYNLVGSRSKMKMVESLSNLWQKLKVEYGYEVLDARWFEEFKTIHFCGRDFMVFKELDMYLESEYGNRWMENIKEYSSGGWSKKSHIVTSPILVTGHRQ